MQMHTTQIHYMTSLLWPTPDALHRNPSYNHKIERARTLNTLNEIFILSKYKILNFPRTPFSKLNQFWQHPFSQCHR